MSLESTHQAIIPGLPDDLAYRCLAKVSHGYHGLLEAVSKTWRDAIRSLDYSSIKASEGWCGNWLFVLTEGNNTHWIAYDPDANRWHPLPKIPRPNSNLHHYGFSCVSVHKKFLVIGGSYASHDPVFPHKRPFVTNDVMQFDPFKKEWCKVASMRTPRSHFACSVVCDKVYVAGGRKSSSTRGLDHVEVYDPLEDRWEELPSMPAPQMDCIGLSYKGRFHVLSDQVGLPDQNTSEVYSPSDGTWQTVEDVWPFSRAMQFAVTVVENDRVYTVVDWGESSIKTRDSDQGEWYNVGSVPPVVLSDHTRPLEAFGYGFAAVGKDLYVLGGKVLKWEESGAGRFDIVKLDLVRVCDPTILPLKWRETRPMCGLARGAVIGCAFLEELAVEMKKGRPSITTEMVPCRGKKIPLEGVQQLSSQFDVSDISVRSFCGDEQKKVFPSKYFTPDSRLPVFQETVLKVSIYCHQCKTDVLKAITKLTGIDKVSVDAEKDTVTVIGDVDPVLLTKQVRKLGKVVEVVSVGPPKPAEDPKPKPLAVLIPLPMCCNDCQYVAVSYASYEGRVCSIL